MFRKLFVLAALALSGCASYGPAQYGDRAPVYRDGSYYSPSASGYGDYYYAPEYRYDDYYDYYDGFGYGYGYGHGYGYPYGFGGQRFCSFRYRPCSYGSYWGSGWGGLSLFFGRGWNSWDSWYGWPYYGGWNHDRDWDRHRDRNRDHDRDRDHRTPSPRIPGEDRNRVPSPPTSTPWPMPAPGARRPVSPTPRPIRDPNRIPGYRDEASAPGAPEGAWRRDPNVAPAPGMVFRPAPRSPQVPRDRNEGGWREAAPPPRGPQAPRDRNGGGWQVVAPPPQAPRDRNGGGWQPQPRAPEPRDRNNDVRAPAPPPPASPPARRERSDERGDRNEERSGARRPALQ
jgi:hypothetical protein